jgi:DNA repair protein RecO (recombination protein O)
MSETATGFIMRIRPLTETSLIIHWLTPAAGRVATVAKGARRPKSPFAGKLDLFYFAAFSFSRSRRSELHTLREVSLLETHPSLRTELGYLQQASYCAGLVESATEMETPLPAVFDLVRELLDALPKRPPAPQTVFAFELKLLNELGLKPDLAQTRLTPGAREIAKRLGGLPLTATAQLRLSAAQTVELDQFLREFLSFHLGRLPKGREAAVRPPSRGPVVP